MSSEGVRLAAALSVAILSLVVMVAQVDSTSVNSLNPPPPPRAAPEAAKKNMTNTEILNFLINGPPKPPPPKTFLGLSLRGSKEYNELCRAIFSAHPAPPYVLTAYPDGILSLSYLRVNLITMGSTRVSEEEARQGLLLRG